MATHRGLQTVCYREYSRACEPGDTPYYPVHLRQADAMLDTYTARARAEPKGNFVGRLGTYRYMDLDMTIRAALDLVRQLQG